MNSTNNIYIQKINIVQDYIEKHLDEEITIDKLSKIACFSQYHFQRVFRQFTSESLYSYIKRIRLEKSVFLLKSNRNAKIVDIALSAGFNNQASFAKALKEKYGITASQIRKMDIADINCVVENNSMNGKEFTKNICYNEPMEISIKNIAPQNVIYTRYTGAYKGNAELFNKLFAKLYQYANKIALVNEDTSWFVVYHEYSDLTQEEKLRLSVCMSIKKDFDNHHEFGTMEIAGGNYAVGKFLIGSNEYQNAWNYMLLKWLPESKYQPDDRLSFEYYAPQIKEDEMGRVIVEIFIPIIPSEGK